MAEESIRLKDEPNSPVLRFAPNPNGPLTIGHARGVVVNSYLAKKYGGKFILRFDDTDPRTKKPNIKAYDWILDDCMWLNAKPDEIIKASDNIDLYYEYAVKLIGLGHAYVCTCEREAFRTRKNQGIECPCRSNSPEENQIGWEKMLDATYFEGEAVLRIKTDIKHKDPALRDFTAFRIIDESHPLTLKKYRVWPLLDFESAIEDHIRGMTHIIRGIDLMDSGLKQKYIYDYFGWVYPQVLLWGRLKIEDMGKFSTSQMSQDIASGKYSGWDDPALPTLRALKRRGILSTTICDFMLGLGLSDSAISISLENIYSHNRKNLDETANRYFFISNPLPLKITGVPPKTIRMPLHPTDKMRGVRTQTMGEGKPFHISSKDAELEVNEIIKLMGLPHVKITSVSKESIEAEYIAGNHKDSKKIQTIQDGVRCRILKPDGEDFGLCETECEKLDIDSIVQFERYGFCRLDSNQDELLFIYGHN